MRAVDSEGVFRGTVVGWSSKALPSGDPIVSVHLELDAVLAGPDWEPIDPRSCVGDFFVVKKTGAPNEKVVEMLCTVIGWGGSFAELHNPPQRVQVAVEVQGRDYKGKTFYQANWLRPAGAALPPPTPDAHALDAKHAELRKLASKFRKPAVTKAADPAAVNPTDIPF